MKHLLLEYRDCPDERILTGNGYIITKGIGNVTIHSSLGLRTIYDIFYVPALSGKNNLPSIPQIVRKDCKITMSRATGCIIYSDDKESTLLLQGSFTGKGFMVDMSVCRTTTQLAKMECRMTSPSQSVLLPSHLKDTGRIAMLAGSEDTQPIEIWHMHLGHLNQAAIQQLSTNATGLIIGPARPQTITIKCESCLRGAQHKNISYQRGLDARKKLEHVWTDIKGPLLDKDVYGFKFFCTFICEYTRWTAEYPLLEKGQVFEAYTLFEARFERLAGERILHLHIDGGPEYLTNDFRSHLRNKGVALCVTQPYSPEMNSIVERAMRTIIEHASAMLWYANLPIGFWSQAVETSVYLMNHSPHSALVGKTPYEAWYGSKPNLGHLRVFGCRAAAHIPHELRTKTDWTSKSSPNCIFIGYSETENLFKLCNVDKRDVIRKRDVIFWEHEMGHPTLSQFALTYSTSIYPNIGTSIASAIAASQREELIPPQPSTPSNNILLIPLDARQTVDKLHPEPKEKDRIQQDGDTTFIPFQVPEEIAQRVANIGQPQLPHDIKYLELINMLDHEFILKYEKESNKMDWDLTPEMHLAIALADPVDAFDLHEQEAGLTPMAIPPLDRDISKNYKQAVRHPKCERWRKAMEKELKALSDNNTWDLVTLPEGRKAFPNKWVYLYVTGPKLSESLEKEYRKKNDGKLSDDMMAKLNTLKQDTEQVMEKARLVARGDFQHEGVDYKETYAPVVKFVSLRILLTWAAKKR